MGMYDYFVAKVKCADCGHINVIEYEQTKDFNCDMKNYKEGDSTPSYSGGDDINPMYDFFRPSIGKFWNNKVPNNPCENCKSAMEIIGIIKNDMVIRILDGRILEKETIK